MVIRKPIAVVHASLTQSMMLKPLIGTSTIAIRVGCRAYSDYSRLMSDKLNALLARLKAHQRDLILAMAEHDGDARRKRPPASRRTGERDRRCRGRGGRGSAPVTRELDGTFTMTV